MPQASRPSLECSHSGKQSLSETHTHDVHPATHEMRAAIAHIYQWSLPVVVYVLGGDQAVCYKPKDIVVRRNRSSDRKMGPMEPNEPKQGVWHLV